MKGRRHDPIAAAILAESSTVDRALWRLRVPVRVRDDLRQEVLFTAWCTALRGRLAWYYPPAVRAFLRIVAARMALEWWDSNPLPVEIPEHHEGAGALVDRLVIARDMLHFLERSTTPARWRAVRAYAAGVPVEVIAANEGSPPATIYTRLRLARLDFAAALRRDEAAIFLRRRRRR